MPELTRDTIARDGAPASFEVRSIAPGDAAEIYVNVRPSPAWDGGDQLAAIYETIATLLNDYSARLFSERVFAGAGAASRISAARRDALGEHDDGVPPTLLVSPPSDDRVHGIQIHAYRGRAHPRPIEHEGELVGRSIEVGERSWVHLAALTSPGGSSPEAQARESYERAVRVLGSLDMDFKCVARTWVWLRDILGWYPQFNLARTAVFADEGLVGSQSEARFLPASTGIGATPADGSACGLEVLAISDGNESIRSSHAAGEQCSAFVYGSAFARVAAVPMPTGRALLISGTAAIDPDGESEHPGDAHLQIDATLRHVRTLIERAGWSEHAVVSAIAYCKTAEIARVFAEEWASLPWPRIELIAEVCRDELLFELEATAAEHA